MLLPDLYLQSIKSQNLMQVIINKNIGPLGPDMWIQVKFIVSRLLEL